MKKSANQQQVLGPTYCDPKNCRGSIDASVKLIRRG